MGLENSPSSPCQASSQGPHCPGKSCHCFLPAPPQSRDIPPNAADSTPGLELGPTRWEARLRKAEGTLPAFHHHPDSGREAGELEESRGAIPGSFLSHKHPPPPALSSPAGSWVGEGAEAGAGAGSRLRGSRKRRKRWGGWGAGAWAIVPFSLDRKLEEKQKTESPPPGAFGESPSG